MRLMLVIVAMLIGPLATGSAAEQNRSPAAFPKTMRVHVVHDGEDQLGVQLAYAVRERLRASIGLPLEVEARKSNLTVSIVSIESSCNSGGRRSSAAVSLETSSTHLLMGLWIVQVADGQADSVSAYIVTHVDKAVQDAIK